MKSKIERAVARYINLKQKTFNKKHWLDFNAINKQKPIHIGEWSQKLNARCLGLRRVRNYATPFHNFCKIVSLHSVFAPVEFSAKTLTSLINCYKQIQNWAVLALFYARLTPSSSQSGKANDESAARHIKQNFF